MASEVFGLFGRHPGMRLAVELGGAVALVNIAIVVGLCAACLRAGGRATEAWYGAVSAGGDSWGPPVVLSKLGVPFERSACIAAGLTYAELLVALEEIETSAEDLGSPRGDEAR